VALGFLVGVAIAGQTLYLFTLAHLKQFAILKAMGLSNRGVVGMILVQAMVVGTVGHALGMGLTALFFETTGSFMHLRSLLPWQCARTAVFSDRAAGGLLSIRRVLVLEPPPSSGADWPPRSAACSASMACRCSACCS
jgi:putative ABC transport system permease protein